MRMSKPIWGKIMVTVLASAMMMSLLTGCGEEKEATGQTLRVGVITYTTDDPFINALVDCLKDDLKEAETEDLHIVVSVRSGDESQHTQDTVVEEVVDAGCDILCVNLVDRTSPSNIIRLARKNNIPVVFFNKQPVKEDLMQWDKLYYVGSDAKQSGQIQGQLAADYIAAHPEVDKNGDGVIQYVAVVGETGHQDAISRTDWSVNTLLDAGVQLEKISYQFADWKRKRAQNRMSQVIEQYGTSIELVLSNNDEMAIGTIQAYKEAGIAEADYPIIFGIDGLDVAMDAIQAGTMQGTAYNDREDQAAQIANITLGLYQGKNAAEMGLGSDRSYFSDYWGLNKENIDEYDD